MLSDTAGFASDHFGITDRIKKRSFTMIDMSHNGNHGRPVFQVFFIVFNFVDHVFDVRIRDPHNFVTKLFDDQFGCIGINGLVLRYHHTHIHQGFDDFCYPLGHPVGELGNQYSFGQLDFAHNLFTLLHRAHRFLARALLLALHRSHGFLASTIARKCLCERQFP